MLDLIIRSLNISLFILCSYVITNAEGTELTLLPRLDEDEREGVVEVVRPPSAETLALVERVFQRASSSDVAGEKATTTRDQLATAAESQGHYLIFGSELLLPRSQTWYFVGLHLIYIIFVELDIGWRVRP